MKSFTYTLQADYPVLLGSASRLAHLASCYPDTTGILEMGTRRADLAHPMQVLTLGIRKGDLVTVSVDGPSEAELFDVLCDHFSCIM